MEFSYSRTRLCRAVEERRFTAKRHSPKKFAYTCPYILADVRPQGTPHGKDYIHCWPGIGVQGTSSKEGVLGSFLLVPVVMSYEEWEAMMAKEAGRERY
jgi:hypothetical protein